MLSANATVDLFNQVRLLVEREIGLPESSDEFDGELETTAPPEAALVARGADLVVGSHAHVLQGDGRLGTGYVAYGLGNFAWYTPGATRSSIAGERRSCGTWGTSHSPPPLAGPVSARPAHAHA